MTDRSDVRSRRPAGRGRPARRRPWIWLLAATAIAAPAAAAPAAAQENQDPFEDVLFAPELVMQNRQRIGLTSDQWSTISGAIREMQREVVDLEWEMLEASQGLIELLEAERVDEAAAMELVSRVLTTENEVKELQLRLLIRIKNALTPEQQDQLRRLRGGRG